MVSIAEVIAKVQAGTGASDTDIQMAASLEPIVARLPTGAWVIGAAQVDEFYACSDCPNTTSHCVHSLAVMLHEYLTPAQEAQPMPHHPIHLTAEDTMDYKGKRFVFYHALLREAQGQGLTALDVSFTYNDATLALAAATATFVDGRRYTEAGDATPDNVGPFVKPHFRRMALTRAKARVLRDALGIQAASVEEMGDMDTHTIPQMTSPLPPTSAQVPVVPTMSTQRTPHDADGNNFLLATRLRMSERKSDGQKFYYIMSNDLPPFLAERGLPVWPDQLADCGLSLDPLGNINGWEVTWHTYVDKNGVERQRVDTLIAPMAPDDDDHPF